MARWERDLAAYIAGLATDHMVARGNTITGSVGVIFQWAEVSQLLDKLGVKMTEIKSGPLKANPSMFQPIDEAGRSVAEQMVAESKRWFVGLVATRRNIETPGVPGLEQGRVFSGREALATPSTSWWRSRGVNTWKSAMSKDPIVAEAQGERVSLPRRAPLAGLLGRCRDILGFRQ
jgi:hypothetical protein